MSTMRRLKQAERIITRMIWEFCEKDNIGYSHGCVGCLEDAFNFMGWESTVTERQIFKILFPYFTDEELNEAIEAMND